MRKRKYVSTELTSPRNNIERPSKNKDSDENLNGEAKSKNNQRETASEAGTGGRFNCCGLSISSVLKVLVLLIIIPPFLNYASLKKESQSLRPSGMFQTSPRGHKLFMNCKGRGQPVIMMDTPGGFSSDIWSLVQPLVAKFTKVCIYDRSGLGFSESYRPNALGNGTSSSDDVIRKRMHPTIENMVDDLHSLMNAVSNESTFILVGGGLGALNARFHAQMFGNVYGVVLVNSLHEEMFKQEWMTFWYESLIPSLQLHQILASLGITRLALLTGFVKPEILRDDRFDDDVKIRHKYLQCNSEHLTSGIREHYYVNESLTQLRFLQRIKPFPKDVVVKVISSEKFSDHVSSSLNQLWKTGQRLFIEHVFPQSENTVVRSDFTSVYFDDAAVIVKAIKKLVSKFRKSTKLSTSM